MYLYRAGRVRKTLSRAPRTPIVLRAPLFYMIICRLGRSHSCVCMYIICGVDRTAVVGFAAQIGTARLCCVGWSAYVYVYATVCACRLKTGDKVPKAKKIWLDKKW